MKLFSTLLRSSDMVCQLGPTRLLALPELCAPAPRRTPVDCSPLGPVGGLKSVKVQSLSCRCVQFLTVLVQCKMPGDQVTWELLVLPDMN